MAPVISSLNIVRMVEEVEIDTSEKLLRAVLAFRPECIVKSAVPFRKRRVGRDEETWRNFRNMGGGIERTSDKPFCVSSERALV